MAYQPTGPDNAVQPLAGRRGFNGVDFTVGAEASNAITVEMQLLEQGNPVRDVTTFLVYVSDAATGLGLGTAPSGGTASGGKGQILVELTAELVLLCHCDSDGELALTLTEATATTRYLVVVDSNGRNIVSPAITFA